MEQFDYKEYLKNNPLLKKTTKPLLKENFEYLKDYGTDDDIQQYMSSLKRSEDMFDTEDDYIEDFKNYIGDKSLEEKQHSSKMKLSEFKAKIKEEIIQTLAEVEDGDLESELMADLEENQLNEEKEEDVDVEDEDISIEDGDEEGEENEEMQDDSSDFDGGEEIGFSKEEQDIQKNLKIAYDSAVSMGDEKLADQIGNTITMFTRTHVVNR